MSIAKEIGQSLDLLRSAIVEAEEKLATIPTSEDCSVGIDDEHVLIFMDWNGSMKLCVCKQKLEGFTWTDDLTTAKPLSACSVKVRKKAAEVIPDLITAAKEELPNYGKEIEQVAHAIKAALS